MRGWVRDGCVGEDETWNALVKNYLISEEVCNG